MFLVCSLYSASEGAPYLRTFLKFLFYFIIPMSPKHPFSFPLSLARQQFQLEHQGFPEHAEAIWVMDPFMSVQHLAMVRRPGIYNNVMILHVTNNTQLYCLSYFGVYWWVRCGSCTLIWLKCCSTKVFLCIDQFTKSGIRKKACFRDRSFMWFLQQRPCLANTYKDRRLETKLKHHQGWLCTIWCVSQQRKGNIMAEYKKCWEILCHTLTINTFKYCFKEVLTVAHPTEELCLTKQRSCGLRRISVQH